MREGLHLLFLGTFVLTAVALLVLAIKANRVASRAGAAAGLVIHALSGWSTFQVIQMDDDGLGHAFWVLPVTIAQCFATLILGSLALH